jgi:hypothetical protein
VRLRAAADALFPPRGEQEKPQAEAERHREKLSNAAVGPATASTDLDLGLILGGDRRGDYRGVRLILSSWTTPRLRDASYSRACETPVQQTLDATLREDGRYPDLGDRAGFLTSYTCGQANDQSVLPTRPFLRLLT